MPRVRLHFYQNDSSWKPHSDSSEHSLRLIPGCLCVYRQSSVSRNAVKPSSSGSSSITCVTGSWCGASRTRGTGRWPTSMRTCSARRTPGPRWVTVVLVFSKAICSKVHFIEMKIQKCWPHYVTPGTCSWNKHDLKNSFPGAWPYWEC